MTFLQIIALLSTIIGASKEIIDIVQDLHAMGLKPEDAIPKAHMDRLTSALAALPNDHEVSAWESAHADEGG